MIANHMLADGIVSHSTHRAMGQRLRIEIMFVHYSSIQSILCWHHFHITAILGSRSRYSANAKKNGYCPQKIFILEVLFASKWMTES